MGQLLSPGSLLSRGVNTNGAFVSGPAFSRSPLTLPSSSSTVAHPVNPVSNLGSPSVAYASPAVSTYGASALTSYGAPAVSAYASPSVSTYGSPALSTYGAFISGP